MWYDNKCPQDGVSHCIILPRRFGIVCLLRESANVENVLARHPSRDGWLLGLLAVLGVYCVLSVEIEGEGKNGEREKEPKR